MQLFNLENREQKQRKLYYYYSTTKLNLLSLGLGLILLSFYYNIPRMEARVYAPHRIFWLSHKEPTTAQAPIEKDIRVVAAQKA